jgi:hypothetical protein
MLLLFPCPGTIPVSSCWPSCQMSCCAPPSSDCVAAASSLLFTALTTAPTPSCGGDPASSPSGSGRVTRLSPPATLRPARKRMPHLAVRYAAADHWASAQVVPPPPSGYRCRTAGFSTFFFSAGTRRSRNCFPTWQGGFCTPGTGGAFTASTDPQTRYPSCQWAPPRRLDL